MDLNWCKSNRLALDSDLDWRWCKQSKTLFGLELV